MLLRLQTLLVTRGYPGLCISQVRIGEDPDYTEHVEPVVVAIMSLIMCRRCWQWSSSGENR